jgi:uncharacterized damage-inducible protein DinB
MNTNPSSGGNYNDGNASARERLQRVVYQLSDTDLARPVGDEWTVATTLAHLAFWDRRHLALLQRWQRAGVAQAPSDSESINAGVQALASAIPPHTTVQLALDAAEAIDHALQQITPQLAAAIDAAGYGNVLRRSIHRNAHLDDIERALGNRS